MAAHIMEIEMHRSDTIEEAWASLEVSLRALRAAMGPKVSDFPKKEGVFIGCHHNDKSEPLIVVMGDDGELFEVGTVDGIEKLIVSYRPQPKASLDAMDISWRGPIDVDVGADDLSPALRDRLDQMERRIAQIEGGRSSPDFRGS